MNIEHPNILKSIDIPESFMKIGFKKKFIKNEIFFSPNKNLEGIFIILKGRAIVFTCSAEGQDRIFFILEHGGVIGERIIVDNSPFKFNIKAIDNIEVLYIKKNELIELLKTDFNANLFIYESMYAKIKFLSYQAGNMTFNTAEDRIYNLLIQFANYYGKEIDNNKIIIDLNLTQQFISDIVGIKRITTCKILQSFKEQKLIEKCEGRYIINNLDRLKQYCIKER